MKKFCILVSALAAGILLNVAAAAQREPLRVFIRAGEKTHGPAGNDQHDYPKFLTEWTRLLTDRGAAVEGALRFPTAEELGRTDVLIIFTGDGGTCSPAERALLTAFTKRGGGLVVLHDGMCSDDPAWFATVAGGAKQHGEMNWSRGILPIRFEDRAHPITRGLPDFELDDEAFFLLRKSPGIHVLASAPLPSNGEVAPQVWTYEKTAPGGRPYRSFVSMLGHYYRNFAEPAHQSLLLRGIAWAGKRDVDLLRGTATERQAGSGGTKTQPLDRTRQHDVVRYEGDVFRLQDSRAQMSLAIAPGVGNVAYSLTVKGHEVLRFPYASVEEFRKSPRLSGIPFMGPWANRLDEQAFYANGKRYAFDMALGNVRGERPIHGFLSSSPHWEIVDTGADQKSAWVTSRLEFFRHPDYMAQFPFAHTIHMTYRLADGAVEVATRVANMSAEPMPVVIGYHPYFRLTDSSRDEWTVSIGARSEWVLSPEKLPTGETRPIAESLGDPQRLQLRGLDLDHVFGDLVRDAGGRAVMSVKGKTQQLEVIFGPNYRAAVVYAPLPSAAPDQDRNFVCFEPMAAITNALNLAHRGVYKELQSIPPGGTWAESFWIRPTGF